MYVSVHSGARPGDEMVSGESIRGRSWEPLGRPRWRHGWETQVTKDPRDHGRVGERALLDDGSAELPRSARVAELLSRVVCDLLGGDLLHTIHEPHTVDDLGQEFISAEFSPPLLRAAA